MIEELTLDTHSIEYTWQQARLQSDDNEMCKRKYDNNGKGWYFWFDYDDNEIGFKYILSVIDTWLGQLKTYAMWWPLILKAKASVGTVSYMHFMNLVVRVIPHANESVELSWYENSGNICVQTRKP